MRTAYPIIDLDGKVLRKVALLGTGQFHKDTVLCRTQTLLSSHTTSQNILLKFVAEPYRSQ